MNMRGKAKDSVIPPSYSVLLELLDTTGKAMNASLQMLFEETRDPFDPDTARFEVDMYVAFRMSCLLRRKPNAWDDLAVVLMDSVTALHQGKVTSQNLQAVFESRVETYRQCWNACVDSKTYPSLQCLQMLRMYIVGAARRGSVNAKDPLDLQGGYMGEFFATQPLVELDSIALGLLVCALKHITQLPGNLSTLSKEDVLAAANRGFQEAEKVLSKPRNSPILRATNLHKTYRMGRVKVPVLRGVDLTVNRGEWVAILGASGSGKSTLLHLLGGLDRPDRPGYSAVSGKCAKCGYDLSGLEQAKKTRAADRCPECGYLDVGGTIAFEGRELGKMSARDLDRYRCSSVGFVFQFYHLLPELTVLQNVTIASMVRLGRFGFMSKRRAVEDRAKALLESFGLGHRLTHRPAELSGGERQRVAIARALANQPPVLLADEPTGNLDHATGETILDQIAKHRADAGLTMVMVTHDRDIARRADRVVQLTDGRVT